MNLLTILGAALAGFDPKTLRGTGLRKAGEKLATLAALEHCCNAVRDEAVYEDVRLMLADLMESDELTVQNVLTIIGDVAHDRKISV